MTVLCFVATSGSESPHLYGSHFITMTVLHMLQIFYFSSSTTAGIHRSKVLNDTKLKKRNIKFHLLHIALCCSHHFLLSRLHYTLVCKGSAVLSVKGKIFVFIVVRGPIEHRPDTFTFIPLSKKKENGTMVVWLDLVNIYMSLLK